MAAAVRDMNSSNRPRNNNMAATASLATANSKAAEEEADTMNTAETLIRLASNSNSRSNSMEGNSRLTVVSSNRSNNNMEASSRRTEVSSRIGPWPKSRGAVIMAGRMPPSSRVMVCEQDGWGGWRCGFANCSGTEMTNMNQTNSSDPNFILNECRAVERAVDELEQRDLEQLKAERQRYLNDFQQDNAAQVKKMEDLWTRIHATYQTLIRRMGVIKGMEASGEPRNSPSVGKADRRIKTSLNRAQQIEREHREKAREQFERQYRIVRPDASAAEVREAEESSDQQVFSSALMQSDRRGNASQVVNSVKARHLDIQNIEKQMMELAQLFQDLETLVVQQEPAVAQIEQKGEEVNDHVSKANVELDGAVKKAAAARRKKWICLGIAGMLQLFSLQIVPLLTESVTIVIIIVVVVVVVVEVS